MILDIIFKISLFLLPIDKCSPDGNYFCKNGGTCTIDATGQASCACTQQHQGLTCETGKF